MTKNTNLKYIVKAITKELKWYAKNHYLRQKRALIRNERTKTCEPYKK